MYALRNTSWALDHRNKEVEVSRERGIFRVVKCHTQLTRLRKGLEIPCKNVRFTYLKAFAEEFNPTSKLNVTSVLQANVQQTYGANGSSNLGKLHNDLSDLAKV
jgi:hypothetical protein